MEDLLAGAVGMLPVWRQGAFLSRGPREITPNHSATGFRHGFGKDYGPGGGSESPKPGGRVGVGNKGEV